MADVIDIRHLSESNKTSKRRGIPRGIPQPVLIHLHTSSVSPAHRIFRVELMKSTPVKAVTINSIAASHGN